MKALIFSSLVLIILAACHKHSPDQNGPGPQYTRVRRLDISWNVLNGGGEDWINFIYDNAGRVSDINAYNHVEPLNSPYDSIFHIYFYYSGTNVLPFSVTVKNTLTESMEYHFLTYNANGQPIRDSVGYCSWTNPSQCGTELVSSFTYSGNTIISKDSSAPTPVTYSADNVNGNFVSFGEYPIRGYDAEDYDFDGGINPLHTLNVTPVCSVIAYLHRPMPTLYSIWTLCNINNVIRIKRRYISSLHAYDDTDVLTYKYNPDGLLQQRIWTERGFVADTMNYIYQ